MEFTKSYDVRRRLFSPVFICLLFLPYYIDYARKLYRYLGFPRYQEEYSFEMISSWIKYAGEYGVTSKDILMDWIALFLYPFIYALYLFVLFHFSLKIEMFINEPYRKLQIIVFPIALTVIIVGNTLIFRGNSNSEIMAKIGWCWGVAMILFATKMFGKQKETI